MRFIFFFIFRKKLFFNINKDLLITNSHEKSVVFIVEVLI